MRKAFFILILFTGNFSYSQLNKGDRILSWQLDLAQNNNYDSSFIYGKQACLENVHLFMGWSDLEQTTGVFSATAISNLQTINAYYPAAAASIEFQFAPLNTVFKSVPTDLQSVSFNSPSMINRFKNVIDTVFKYMPSVDITAFNIGNESDIILGIDSNGYIEYKVFLDSVIPYVKQKYFALHSSNLKIGTTLTHSGLTASPTKDLCKKLNKNLDIVAVTYYPLNSDYTMKNPSVVPGDFNVLISEYSDTNQPIYFVECGYSTSDSCNSNEALQAKFYENVFDAWDIHYTNIKLLTVFKSVDWSQAQANQLSIDYGITDNKFIEYLRTLGVRTWTGNGTSKLAYFQIMCELQARNWCSLAYCNSVSIEENMRKSDLLIFPNPATGDVTISSKEIITQIILFDSYGKVILTSSQNNIEINQLPQGIYFVSVELENGKQFQRKLIKN